MLATAFKVSVFCSPPLFPVIRNATYIVFFFGGGRGIRPVPRGATCFLITFVGSTSQKPLASKFDTPNGLTKGVKVPAFEMCGNVFDLTELCNCRVQHNSMLRQVAWSQPAKPLPFRLGIGASHVSEVVKVLDRTATALAHHPSRSDPR